jgi:hypothetical protein
MKRGELLGIIVAGCTLGIIGFLYWYDHERRLLADIEEMSKSGRVGNYTRSFDYVCFSPSASSIPQEFGEALKSSGLDLYTPLNTCGIRRTCCDQDSNYSVVGLIKDGEIRCLEIRRFSFIPGDDRTLCARPSELQVTLETHEGPDRDWTPPGAIIRRGTQYYRIRRGKK